MRAVECVYDSFHMPDFSCPPLEIAILFMNVFPRLMQNVFHKFVHILWKNCTRLSFVENSC